MADEFAPDKKYKFTFGLWTVGNPGRDPFGQPTRDPLTPAQIVDVLGEVGAYGVNFHDNDLVPIDATAAEAESIKKDFRRALKDNGIVVPMATTNLFGDPVFKDGAFTSNNARTRAYAIQKTMRAMDLGAEFGAKFYVFWGGREGAESDATKDPVEAVKRFREAINFLCEYSISQGYNYKFAFEAKPNEPRGHMYFAVTGMEVVRVNDPTSDLKAGDRCTVEPYLNCGHCIACRRGKSNCCTDLRVLGVHVDGGMRERIVVPANKLHRSAKLSLDQLALVETLAIGCHAVARANVEKDENVLVIRAGPIGLAAIQFVQAAGAIPAVADTSEERLTFCRQQLSVTQTLDGRHDLKAAFGGLPTCVIDATGNAGSMGRCFELTAHGGRIVFVGLFQGDVTFNDPNFHRREITLMSSRNALPTDFTRIIKLVEDGVIDTAPWITHRAACADLPKTLPSWVSSDAHLLKAMLEF